MLKKWALGGGLGLVFALLVIQAVPYGRDHSNPPVLAEPSWDSPRTRELTVRACYDCHSNEVNWPWYSNVAPVSWRVQNEVDEGRETLNFSEWVRTQDEADESAEAVSEGSMPPRPYLLFHPSARLSDSEKADLMQGLSATFGASDGQEDDDDD